jgi:hypothetical protein
MSYYGNNLDPAYSLTLDASKLIPEYLRYKIGKSDMHRDKYVTAHLRVNTRIKFDDLPKNRFLIYKEARCAYLKLKGYSYDQISKELGLEFCAVKSYFYTVKNRFKAKSIDGALSIIVEHDFIKKFEDLQTDLNNE